MKMKFNSVWSWSAAVLLTMALVCVFARAPLAGIGFFGATLFCLFKAR